MVDREHAAWPMTAQQMNELWRLRVKNDAISLMLTGKTWPQTADLLRKRYSNREIASFLGISESTVKFHVSNVMSKQNVHCRRELTAGILAQTSIVRTQIAQHLPAFAQS